MKKNIKPTKPTNTNIQDDEKSLNIVLIEDGEVEQGTEEWLFLIQLALKAYGINIEDESDILAAIDGEGPYAEQIENLDYEHISDLETALENLGVEVF